MYDGKDLLRIIKRAAVDAVEAMCPVRWGYGDVVGVAPLRIELDQRLTIGEAQLVLTRRVTGADALEPYDKVVLLRQQGGQKYLVIDKVGKYDTDE